MTAQAPRPAVDLVEALGVGPGIVCLVGAGGKKTAMRQLAARLTGRVAVTASVHTLAFRRDLAEAIVIAGAGELAVRVGQQHPARVVAYAGPGTKKARLGGVEPELVARIHAACGFDVTLVKADGARLRHIKAPGPHEPVLIPGCERVISLISIRALGAPLDPYTAHRPQRIAELTGAVPGQPIRAEHIARLLSHPQGGLKYADRTGCMVPVINMVDDDAQMHAARWVAEQVLERSAVVERVVLTRMLAEQPVVAVIRR